MSRLLKLDGLAALVLVALVLVALVLGGAPLGAESSAPSPLHRFTVGEFRCVLINVGQFSFDARAVVPDAPQALLAALGQDKEPVVFEIHALFVDTGDHRVLIEPGGLGGPQPLLAALRQAGVEVAGIDTVVISHGHLDHFGGAVGSDGQPAFPKARHFIQRREWEHWTAAGDNPEPSHVDNFKRLLPLRERFALLEGDAAIVPGIEALFTPGHSPGHMAVRIGGRAVYTGDVLFHTLQVAHPEWAASFDKWPKQVVETRRRLLARLAAEDALVVTTHLGWPGIGRVRAEGDTWRWVPEPGDGGEGSDARP